MLSLQQIKHDKFYIDCGDNATLRECVKLLPYGKNWVQLSVLSDGGIGNGNKVIAVENNSTYYTINGPHAIEPIIYHYSNISEFATHLHSNWYDNVHIMD